MTISIITQAGVARCFHFHQFNSGHQRDTGAETERERGGGTEVKERRVNTEKCCFFRGRDEEERWGDGEMGADRETGGMEKKDGYAEGGMDRAQRMREGGVEEGMEGGM